MIKKDYIKKLEKANNKKFLKLIKETNKNNIIGIENGIYFVNDDVTIGFDNEDIYDYLKEIKNVNLDFNKEDEDFKDYITQYYLDNEDDVDEYFILKNRYEYIEQLKEY
jgi:hypothetical protein